MPALRSLVVLFLLTAIAVLLTSCSQPQTSGYVPEDWKYRKAVTKSFKPITDHRLELAIVSKRLTFLAGETVEINFQLINRGSRTVTIPEWMMIQENNLKIYYRPLKPDPPGTPFKESEWICLQPNITAAPDRSELTLNPRNSVLVAKKLPFIRTMAQPAHPVQFQIIAATNLASLQLKSEIITITVK